MITKLSLRLPSGLQIEFEGDADVVDQFRELVKNDLPDLLEGLGAARPTGRAAIATRQRAAQSQDADEPVEQAESEIDVAGVASNLEELGAKSDIERVAIMAFYARDAGQPGLDAQTADYLYTELGLPKPGVWRSTFQNAKKRGFLKSAGRGVWAPTYAGENLARHGIRPSRRR